MRITKMDIYCCQCGGKFEARLTNGKEIYPHRPDLYKLPFWKHDLCGNFVGCHHKTKNPTAPLGCIPSKEIKELRKKIHALLDPIWQQGKISRRDLYQLLSDKTGRKYHTANLRSVEECNQVLFILNGLAV